jgi:NAD(P)-dependent dehydrogenase (short-subunit alcohol dehydrogenase family)
MRFTDKTALITGGNSGIGFAVAKLLIAEGARVAITGRDRAKLDEAASELGANALAIQADLDDPAAIDLVIKQVGDAYGSLDIVFANAGISGPTPLGSTTAAAFEAILRTNLTAVFLTVQSALPLMSAGGSIVLNGSVMRELGRAGTAAYRHGEGVRRRARATRHSREHGDPRWHPHADLDTRRKGGRVARRHGRSVVAGYPDGTLRHS